MAKSTNAKNITLDPTDRKILNVLQNDASLSTKELANKVGLTATPTYERLKKLEHSGVIQKEVVLLNKAMVDREVMVFVQLTLQKHEAEVIEKFRINATQKKEVLACFHVAGNYDFMLQVVVSDLAEYREFLNELLQSTPHVSNVHSSFVMTEMKNTTAIML